MAVRFPKQPEDEPRPVDARRERLRPVEPDENATTGIADVVVLGPPRREYKIRVNIDRIERGQPLIDSDDVGE